MEAREGTVGLDLEVCEWLVLVVGAASCLTGDFVGDYYLLECVSSDCIFRPFRLLWMCRGVSYPQRAPCSCSSRSW